MAISSKSDSRPTLRRSSTSYLFKAAAQLSRSLRPRDHASGCRLHVVPQHRSQCSLGSSCKSIQVQLNTLYLSASLLLLLIYTFSYILLTKLNYTVLYHTILYEPFSPSCRSQLLVGSPWSAGKGRRCPARRWRPPRSPQSQITVILLIYWVYIGIMEKKMDTTIMGYLGIIGLVSSLGLYRDYIGIMEMKMETTI